MESRTDNLRMSFSSSSPNPSPVPPAHPGQTSRLFWRWWRKQTPSQQDRYATLGPLVSVLLFLAAIIVAFWYLRNEEIEREQESVKRDTEVVQQQIRMRLVENQEQLLRLAREIALKPGSTEAFTRQAGDFVRARPEVTSVTWVQSDARVRAYRSALSLSMDPDMAQEDMNGEARLDWREQFPGGEPMQAFQQTREIALQALENVGMQDHARTALGHLSGGQQQRVAIARALVTDPTLIVADEPTGDLDRQTGEEILVLLDELHRDLGKTIVMVTHDPKAAARASRQVELEKGVLVDSAVTL